ncbi:MAG: class I SAM-dependent RNA methyltransferase, partial [Pseudomonadota bacterium]
MSEAEVEIAWLGRQGDGIDAGATVFAARTLPGERIAGAPDADGRIAAPRILRPSADRVAAPCPAVRRCGGCALMHASDAFVAGWKRDRIAEALATRGLSAEIRETATSPAASRRRAALSGRRGKSGATVGFHARRGEVVVDAAPCRVLVPTIVDALPALA